MTGCDDAQSSSKFLSEPNMDSEVTGSISAQLGLSFEFSIVAVGANWAPLELLPDLCEISAMLRCRLVQLLNPKPLKKPWETTA
jgi:hypothetical protein